MMRHRKHFYPAHWYARGFASTAMGMGCGSLVLTAVVALAFSCGASAEEPAVYTPYCGISCVYVAARSFQVPVEFTSLLNRRYLSAKHGSSLADLDRAATDLGLYAEIYENLTIDSIASAESPVILLVKKDAQSREFDHYVVALGADRHGVRLMDPPHAPTVVSYAELLQVWAGDGVVLSDSDQGIARFRRKVGLQLGIVLSCVAVFAGLLRLAGGHLASFGARRPGRMLAADAMAGMFLLVLLGSALGFTWHFFRPEGFLYNVSALDSARTNRITSIVPHVSASQVAEFVKSGAIIIDARWPRDYDAGHIPGARNIPPDTSLSECADMLRGQPGGRRYVVYCQSSKCPYAGTVARLLMEISPCEILYFKEGWNGWVREGRST